MTLEELRTLLGRWDDDAWIALASKGLLRRARKDLATLEPTAREEGDRVAVDLGGHVVRFGAEGPATASCTCASAAVCHHVVAAGLWLAAGPQEDDGPAPDPHDELMSLDAAALRAYAGLAAYRWAFQVVADLDEEAVAVERAAQVRIAIPSPRVTFRYAGGGLAALLPDVRLTQVEKYRVAAVLAYQRAFGRAPDPPPGRARSGTPADSERAELRRRLRSAVTGLLLDTARVGASHLSAAFHERYETVAVWAQGAEYHRLARLLRGLADQVELLLERNARADEHALLDGCATALALTTALERSAGAGAEPPRLVGRARTTYDQAPTLELIGLGGMPWRSGTGYHGLTCLFWWPAEQRFLSWTDARPVGVPGFEPRHRWSQDGPWEGLASPSETPGRSVRLRNARMTPAGRISGTESTLAAVGAASAELLAGLPVITSWSDLAASGSAARSLIDEPDPLADWTLLAPRSWGPPAYDAARQTLVVPLRDDEDAVLLLELRWSALAAPAVRRLESLASSELPPGARLVARLARRRGVRVGEPLSLVLDDGRVEALHFGADDGADSAASDAGDGREGEEDGALEPDLPAPLRDLRAWTLRQLERGTGSVQPSSLLEQLDARHRLLRDVGLSVFPAVGADGRDPAEALLRSHYLACQVAALVG